MIRSIRSAQIRKCLLLSIYMQWTWTTSIQSRNHPHKLFSSKLRCSIVGPSISEFMRFKELLNAAGFRAYTLMLECCKIAALILECSPPLPPQRNYSQRICSHRLRTQSDSTAPSNSGGFVRLSVRLSSASKAKGYLLSVLYTCGTGIRSILSMSIGLIPRTSLSRSAHCFGSGLAGDYYVGNESSHPVNFGAKIHWISTPTPDGGRVGVIQSAS
ncbi:uncharacterized protein F4812DRAFT_24218 [Daldinia caldariorum]|uniref:uncharacterized protein n=1 Tax=Daldinia caldariorum TaxID=326644 RepID=UPI002007E4DE|nr:uncharacterized protein F4812DRAFT_24218 [Daldinia caldariorum]KAI1472759.1 hypothetical protein F4812DRAFT_24218 [Daldinia caldariorum]